MTTITGDKTNETFTAESGVTYNGQGGIDTLVFSGTYAEHDIAPKGTGNIKTVVTWDEGALDTKWIETFVFDDGVYDVVTGEFQAYPTLSITNGAAQEGNQIKFTISLSAATDHDVTVTYFTQGNTAMGMGNDFFGTPGTSVTIAAGQTSIDIFVQTREDALVEPNETFFVRLTDPVGATIADNTGVGTIVNDDAAPLPHVTLSAIDDTAVEGETLQFLFTRSGDTSGSLDVAWTYNPPLPLGAATPGDDFVDPVSKVIHFDPGETDVILTFQTIADDIDEGTEAFAITIVPSLTYTFFVESNIGSITDAPMI